MATAPVISNQIQQKGLLPTSYSTSPFLGGGTTMGGTTTPAIQGAMQTSSGGQPVIGAYGMTTTSPTYAPTPTSANLSGLVSPGSTQNGTGSSNLSYGGPAQGGLTPEQINAANSAPQGQQGASFPGLVSSLAGVASQPSSYYNQNQNNSQAAQSGLMNIEDPNNPLNANINQRTQALQDLQNEYAKQNSIIGNSPIGLSEQGGEQGLLNAQYNTKLDAAQQALNTATTNRGQQITALNNAGGLANTATGNATTQQGTQQQGLGQAGNLSQPSYLAPGQSPYYPSSGAYGQLAGSQNGGGIASVGAMNAQIQQGGAVQQMTGQQAQAQTLGNTLSSLITSAGINPTAGAGVLNTWANGVNQWIQNNTGDPQYQNFANLINEISSRYASILNQSGGTPTDQSTLSHQIINGLASGQDIQTVLSQLDKNASASINALKGASGSNSVSGGSTFGSFF